MSSNESLSVAGAGPRPPLLRLEQVHCELGGAMVVRGVSLSLAAGELGCLLGPSGCGKTTLLRAIAGFQPVAQGSILLRDRLVASATHATAPEARGVGLVFQDLALFPHLNVAGNVGFGLHRLPRAEREPRVREALSLLDLSEFAERFPHELSGGQQQRAAIARAIAPRPELLLLDEPFSSLDADLRRAIRDQMRALLKRLRITALLVTHDQEEAFAFADNIGVMRAGHLVQWDSAFDVYHRPADAFVARFVGEGRLIPGRIRADGLVDTELGLLGGELPPGLACGAAVEVLLRPDDIQPDGDNGLSAEVLASAFRGADTMYTLRLPGGSEVSAMFPSHHQHAVGERIQLRLDLEHVVVFPAGSR